MPDMSLPIEELTPRQIVAELDKYIVGQAAAKRAVAVALRNRYRRQQLPQAERDDILPKNILMIGPTGVGKTEIARRLAAMARAPLIKVEATKFTEVGYVGRDVESMIRDLAAAAVRLVEREKIEAVRPEAERHANERLVDMLDDERPRRRRRRPRSARPPMTTPSCVKRWRSSGSGWRRAIRTERRSRKRTPAPAPLVAGSWLRTSRRGGWTTGWSKSRRKRRRTRSCRCSHRRGWRRWASTRTRRAARSPHAAPPDASRSPRRAR
jgi:hypothetical protein